MTIKTSVTLSEDLLEAVDAHIGPAASRSEFNEWAVRSHLAGLVRREQDARDLEITNRYADEVNHHTLKDVACRCTRQLEKPDAVPQL